MFTLTLKVTYLYDMKQKLRLTDKAKCNLDSQTHKAKIQFIHNLIEPPETNACALKNDLNRKGYFGKRLFNNFRRMNEFNYSSGVVLVPMLIYLKQTYPCVFATAISVVM